MQKPEAGTFFSNVCVLPNGSPRVTRNLRLPTVLQRNRGSVCPCRRLRPPSPRIQPPVHHDWPVPWPSNWRRATASRAICTGEMKAFASTWPCISLITHRMSRLACSAMERDTPRDVTPSNGTSFAPRSSNRKVGASTAYGAPTFSAIRADV